MRKNIHVIAATVLAVAAIAGAGCTRRGAVPVIPDCTTLVPPSLLYPAPGATTVPTASLQLYFGYANNPSPAFSPPVLTPSVAGSSLVGDAYASPSPGPTPAGSLPVPSGDQSYVSNITNAAAGMTYTVTLTSECGTLSLGSFST